MLPAPVPSDSFQAGRSGKAGHSSDTLCSDSFCARVYEAQLSRKNPSGQSGVSPEKSTADSLSRSIIYAQSMCSLRIPTLHQLREELCRAFFTSMMRPSHHLHYLLSERRAGMRTSKKQKPCWWRLLLEGSILYYMGRSNIRLGCRPTRIWSFPVGTSSFFVYRLSS